jgi:HSP20 family protein
MDLKKLAPWNWFKNEQKLEQQPQNMLFRRPDMPVSQDHPVLRLHREIDKLFESALRGVGFAPGSDRESSASLQSELLKPTLDLAATENEYTISVELPGVECGEVKLELVDDSLKIEGEKRQEKEQKEKDFYRMERSYGSFQRVLSLPDDADQNQIEAVFKNGVMTITVPRKSIPESEVKQIEVRTH